ncbi:regulating synaptic membrane exocytosis protein 2-like isoform X3 [Bicyclus anynana]|uniref:Regulating synaptic membrane exocytosis protein 2-like isoform X3 n=1 Tax=Bicyclus anynana TaxID=110368 RepID=A0A6J1MVH6_BICAN|nr:regulating synaptic membrane exocytosis protein 2-like isoform X3 [Bicyclus anynana]
MDDMPDLSHLTPEERAIIEGVIMRQRQEEQREHEIMRRKQDEVAVLEQTIRTRNEMHRAAGVELAATCHICLKTKFADGVGHSCHYCRVRCCARCGGKVTLRSNKVIWVCILCRKKQELLSKTGQWIHKSAGQDSMLWQMESDLRGLPPQGETSIDKRPKLERAHSAAEKENLPLQRSGSALRRQYSQQEARCYGELEGLARTHPHLVHPRQKAAYGVEDAGLGPAGHAQLLPPLGPGLPLPPRSSSSDDEAPECVSDENDEYRDRGQLEACSSLRHAHLRGASVAANNYYNLTNHSPAEYLPEAARGAPAGGRSFDSVTDCRWRARDDGEGSYLRPYAPDGGPRPDRAVYKSAYLWEDSSDNRRFTERRKKTVRFDGHEGAATFPRGGRDASGAPHDWASLRWEAERQTSQDSATKDSGIDTSSTFTSSEDSNRGDCPKFPLNWQVSPDGTRMIGHMVLRKSVVEGSSHSSAAILGLKVVGGKILPDGTRGAIVEKVKKGSIADLEGQLKIGDEVLQWNGVPLQGRGADEVAAVVANSKHDSHVELVVSRPLAPSRPPVQCWRAHKEVYSDMMMGGCEKPSVLVTSPGSPDVHARRRSARQNYHNVSVSGRIQLKVFFDIPALQLLVTVVSATGLCPRSDGSPRCPYSKIFLLPDKSEKSKRRTKTLANTLEPRWNQTFVYCGIRISDLKKRTLEVTVWDLNRYGPNDFLGEVLLDLDSVIMNQEANWYLLKPHEEIPGYSRYRDDDVDGEHLSPPSTSTSRLSDSDTPSECDLRRHHSLSSLASSSSPPPPHEIEETRCSRRDMSPAGRVRTAGMSRERSGYVARSQSAAGGRSASPRRSLSPPGSAPRYAVCEERDAARLPTHAYAPRFQSRSATATPTTSPKKRQLPQIPHQSGQRAMRAQVSADLEERWERHYAGLSDSELAARGGGWAPRRRLSPDAAAADSDLESVASVTSSAFSTQSERPRPTRMLSRMQTLPVYSTSSFCESFAPALECYYKEAAVGEIFNIHNSLSQSYISPTFTTHLARPNRRLRRLLSRSRSAGAYPKDSTPLLAYDRGSSYSESSEQICDYYTGNDAFESIKFKHSKSFESYINSFKEKPLKIRHKHRAKRKSQSQSSRYHGHSEVDSKNYYQFEKNRGPHQSKLIKTGYRNKLHTKKHPDTVYYNESNGRRDINIHNISSEIENKEDNNHHFHGYASDDSIAETTIHISLDRQYSLDNDGLQGQAKKQSDANNSFEAYSLNNNRNAKNMEANYKDVEKFNYEFDGYEKSKQIGQNAKYKRYYDISPPRLLNPLSPEEKEAMFTKLYISRHPKKGLIQTDVNQDEELLAWDGHVKRLPKIPTYNGHYSQNSFSHYPNLVRTFEHPLPPNINAYSQSPPYASNHVDQEYSKMANSLSVGLSPTNLGSPRGVLTSVAPHLPSDDTHHNTTEATTYLPSAADSTRDEPKTSNTSNEERHDTSTAETDDTRPKTINSPDVECSNDYGGRENGRNHSQQPTLERRESRRGQFTRSLSNTDAPDEKTDGSLSDTALGGNIEIEPVTDDSLLKAEPRDFFGPGMGKKSNSTSQLSATGRKRRLGFGKRGKNSFTVQRSEEVVPGEMRLAGVSRASSASSENDDERWSPGMRGSGSSDGTGFSEFVDGLGPAQLIGRHILGSPPLGDIQLSLRFQKGFLEVEVIRARGLQARQGSRSIPAPYVKVYLVNGKKCFAKAKTNTARRTLDPLYQQTLTFRENLPGCILQVTVWGDYGRLEGKKVFMGVAQIVLDQLNLANIVIGWYKLFATTALVGENVAPATISSVQQ